MAVKLKVFVAGKLFKLPERIVNLLSSTFSVAASKVSSAAFSEHHAQHAAA